MLIDIRDEDYEKVDPSCTREHLADEDKRDAALRLLPEVIRRKVEAGIPEDYRLKSLTISGEVSGAPFGIGLKGAVKVVLEPDGG